MHTTNQLTQALHTQLNPTFLELENESHQHAGYVSGKESHFKLTIVSADFNGKRLVQRHQLVYHAVAELLTSGGGSVHALAIHAYTADEWATQGHAPDSPRCAGQHKS